MKNKYDTHVDLMQNNRVIIITHPKKPNKHAEIIVKYPKDGAGRLRVSLRDCFGDTCEFSTGYAGGYGYDKLVAAMSGLVIDGHTITDHCGEDTTSAKLLKAYSKASVIATKDKIIAKGNKLGYRFYNWTSGGGYMPTGKDGYQSCYKESGLDYLRALGYNVLTIG